MSHYAFCPKCGVRHGTTQAQAAANGIECGVCGEKFFPQKVERQDDSGGFISFFGGLLILVGIAACVLAFFGFPPAVGIGAGAMSTGGSLIVVAQLFHIRQAVEKLNSKK